MASCILHADTEESSPSQVFVCSMYKEKRLGNKYCELDQQLRTWDKRTKEYLETTLSDAMSPKAIIMLFLSRWLKNLKALIFCFLVSKEDVPGYEKAPQPHSTLPDWEESRPLLKTLQWPGHTASTSSCCRHSVSQCAVLFREVFEIILLLSSRLGKC